MPGRRRRRSSCAGVRRRVRPTPPWPYLWPEPQQLPDPVFDRLDRPDTVEHEHHGPGVPDQYRTQRVEGAFRRNGFVDSEGGTQRRCHRRPVGLGCDVVRGFGNHHRRPLGARVGRQPRVDEGRLAGEGATDDHGEFGMRGQNGEHSATGQRQCSRHVHYPFLIRAASSSKRTHKCVQILAAGGGNDGFRRNSDCASESHRSNSAPPFTRSTDGSHAGGGETR